MRGYIEVTESNGGRKVLVNIQSLEAVYDEGSTAAICIKANILSRKISRFVIDVEESYWEVKELIASALEEVR